MNVNRTRFVATPAILIATVVMALRADVYAQAVFRNYTTKAAMHKSNAAGWAKVEGQCTVINEACAQAAIIEVSFECGADAELFSRDTKKWQYLGFSLIIASAVFTAVGASATIAQAKVYSTLGGTTGLGAVASTVNSNATSDQSGLASVNSVLTAFLKFLQTGGADGKSPPTPALVYTSAPVYAAQCAAAASSSPGGTSGSSASPKTP